MEYNFREDGKAEGIEETNEKNALVMLSKGFNVSVISEITGLTEDRITELQKTVKSCN